MTITQSIESEQLQDRFGGRVAAYLTSGTAELPYTITERLRAARTQAVAVRKPAQLQVASAISGAGSATLTYGNQGPTRWRQVASAIPLLVLAAGLILINIVQNERRASEVAEVDAALLTDDLPPSAYADPGFAQFLKANRD